ncbi:serine/threonine-protein phosphatase [Methylobacterium sp. NEAU 140]|uniref:PP2C family protein-serine/threonine phosphatase n=1 Tax=Methylobacterium sp. NEAU 140 TaxID=3064945 RepID=UPI002734D954|nr:PP2C family serine/threonine-protein phosphatase [Methylobacterium sp. NEAU 140]MDP4024938.1 serine/threonine-protein phosphatase [Methylobacterium sp. NEAU 140]
MRATTELTPGALGRDAMRIEYGAVTHPGAVRAANEDSYLLAPEIGVFAVADGMGGHAEGAAASAAVVEALASIGAAVSAADLMARLEDRILRANAALWRGGQARRSTTGSTVAVLLLFGHDFAGVWSGDSRIYRIRQHAIQQITRDHTEGRDLFERGILSAAEMAAWPRRHVITRAIGVHEEPGMDLEQGAVLPGDVFVLCSDGLTGTVSDGDILLAADTSAPQWACEALLALTLERGAPDNVTVVILRCGYAQPDPVPAGRAATVNCPARPALDGDAR